MNFNKYDEKPIKLLLHGKSDLMPKYLWILFGITFTFSCILQVTGFFNFENVDASNFIDFSVGGLSFTLVIVSATKDIFTPEELKILINGKVKDDEIPGKHLIDLLVPYAFTSLLFLVIGFISLFSPYVHFSFVKEVEIFFNIVFLNLNALAFLSLFNITFTVLIDIYNTAKL